MKPWLECAAIKLGCWILSMIVSGVIGGLIVNFSGVKVVDRLYARELRIIDSAGNTRIFAGESAAGPKIFLFSSAKEPLIHIGLDGSQALLSLQSESMHSSVVLIAEEDRARLAVGNQDGKSVVAINLGQHSPGIIIHDADKGLAWKTPLK